MTASRADLSGVSGRFVRYDDPVARPLLVDLEREYDERYGDLTEIGTAAEEIYRYPAASFAPEGGGAFLILEERGVVIAGAAFMAPSEDAAARVAEWTGTVLGDAVEVKRVWTHPDHRRRGLARRAMAELEAEAARRGVAEIVLSTGPRQPEALGLYLATGYTPLFEVGVVPAAFEGFYFHKPLPR